MEEGGGVFDSLFASGWWWKDDGVIGSNGMRLNGMGWVMKSMSVELIHQLDTLFFGVIVVVT